MKKVSTIFVAVALAVFLVAGSVMAYPINTRPIIDPKTGVAPVVGSSTSTLDYLQSVFTGINSSINVYNDQETAAYFMPTSAGSSSSYVASLTWGWTEKIGLYSYADPTVDVLLYDASSWSPSVGQAINIDFDFANDIVTTSYTSGGTSYTIDSQSGFGYTFGFFIETEHYGRWYSDDSLNNGLAQILVFEGKGDLVTIGSSPALDDTLHWYAAFEGGYNNGTFEMNDWNIDFNDVVIQLESVKPVPEPMTMLLLGFGLLGIGIVRRNS